MKRKFSSYPVTDFPKFKYKMLGFLQKSGIFCFLDNHEYDFNKSYECIASYGIVQSVASEEINTLSHLDALQKGKQDWIFGHASYDLKNKYEHLYSSNFDGIQFPDFFFFIPEVVLILSETELQIGVVENKIAIKIYDEIKNIQPEGIKKISASSLKKRFSKEEYIKTIKKLQEHILRGDCYEINFCQEFYSDNMLINPLSVYKKLSLLSPNPFSAFYKYHDKYLLCASPERFLKKSGNTIFSQPIKGTSRRILNNDAADNVAKQSLLNNEKERSENIMIVDLVRNDLTKICKEGSVIVKEFLKIYSFPQVHQMISTVGGTLKRNTTLSQIFAATFPMGSMTGAPKKKVMELIEQYEKTKRGLFSGTVGYINPEGDFDFNVVIRSILYNKSSEYLSIQTGSAITFKSDPEKEYEECLIKLDAMKKALE